MKEKKIRGFMKKLKIYLARFGVFEDINFIYTLSLRNILLIFYFFKKICYHLIEREQKNGKKVF